ncbi:hypothetical protein [Pseudoduganella sp. HUAS MS19]
MNLFRSKLTFLFLILLSISFGICLYPENPARLLTKLDPTTLLGSEKSKVAVTDVAHQLRQLRQSVTGPEAYFYRNWTPEAGMGPLKIQSSVFIPSKYMSVIVTGSTRTVQGLVRTYIQCERNGARLEVFNGSVNSNISEAIVSTPKSWCSEGARLILETSETLSYVGIGSVYKISPISYWKLSFLGQFPYYFTTLLVLSFLMFAGAAAALRYRGGDDPLPVAFVSLGIASLGVFYLPMILSEELRRFSPILVISFFIFLFMVAGAQARKAAAERLLPYFKVWSLISLVCFAILCLAYNGLGHWEPNYRFWPAAWSSDAELPWLFAEAIRNEWNLRELFGGQWMPTDRPPLMTGALLLLADVFGQLQLNNDGNYLRGTAFNVASVALNTLWAPAIWWLLSKLAAFLNKKQFAGVLLFIACTPFVLFNSVYGWPKAFGAAFAMVAFGLVWQLRPATSIKMTKDSALILFPIVCALSMLAHMSGAIFIAPLGVLYLLWCIRGENLKKIAIGGSIALSLLASWSIYKYLILPSSDPVTKYALTGSFGFGSQSSTWDMLLNCYRAINIQQWLEVKKIMFAQAFYPVDHMITNVLVNADYGANSIDKLRALDFMFLSVGNSGILVCCAASVIWLVISRTRRGRDDAVEHLKPFSALLLTSILTWLVIVMLFIAPTILHHWPQAAVFGLALGGSVITQYRFPKFYKALLLVLLTYAGTVWIISPLQHALTIDMSAAIFLIMLLGAAFIYREGPQPSEGHADSNADVDAERGRKAQGLRAVAGLTSRR